MAGAPVNHIDTERGASLFTLFTLPMFVGDYLVGTTHLSLEEKGAYTELLFNMWARGGRLPSERMRLARILGVALKHFEQLWQEIGSKFDDDGEWITNPRLTAELHRSRGLKEQRTERARRAANKRWSDAPSNARSNAPSNAPSNAQAVPETCPPSPTPSIPSSIPKSSTSTPPAEGVPPPRPDYRSDWNAKAKEHGWQRINKITPDRARHLRAREADSPGSWPGILAELDRLDPDWLAGFPGWGFDWIIKSDSNWTKVLEGKYRARQPAPRTPAADPSVAHLTEMLDDLRRNCPDSTAIEPLVQLMERAPGLRGDALDQECNALELAHAADFEGLPPLSPWAVEKPQKPNLAAAS